MCQKKSKTVDEIFGLTYGEKYDKLFTSLTKETTMNAFRKILVFLFSISLIFCLVLMSTVNGEPMLSLQSILPGVDEYAVGSMGALISAILLIVTVIGFKSMIRETFTDLAMEGLGTAVMFFCFSVGNSLLGNEYLLWTLLGSIVIGLLTMLIIGHAVTNRFR